MKLWTQLSREKQGNVMIHREHQHTDGKSFHSLPKPASSLCWKTKDKKSDEHSYITLQLKQTAVFPVTQTTLFSSSSSHHYLHPRGGLGGGEKRFLLQVEWSAETASAFLIRCWRYPIRGTEWCQRDSCPTQGSLAHEPPARSWLAQDHWWGWSAS